MFLRETGGRLPFFNGCVTMHDQTLETERLVLRPFRPDDAPRVRELAGAWDVASMSLSIPHPYPAGAAEAWIGNHANMRASGRAHHFAMTLDGDCIGAIGLHRENGANWLVDGDVFEIGYWVGLPYWRRGFASEALSAVLAFAFETLAQQQLVAGHFTDNPVSARLLDKAGFAPVRSGRQRSAARDADVGCVFLVLTRDAWASKRV